MKALSSSRRYATDPKKCPDGTYQNTTGASECTACPPGYYCDSQISTVSYLDCPMGYYCPIRTGLNWTACPVGKYGSRLNLMFEDDCTGCDAGKYCSRTALTKPVGNCSAGFYCPEGSENSWGRTIDAGNHTCPRGSFCPAGSAVPSACPPGTYNPSEGMASQAQCLSCTPGSYCDRYNLTEPTDQCSAGYYCSRSATTAMPTSSTQGGGVCPVGHFCPRNTSAPFPCAAGTFNNMTQQTSCSTCPPGFYCPSNTIQYSNNLCPKGYFCPAGTTYAQMNPCPAGTYNNLTQRLSRSQCVLSPAGYYSSGTGNLEPTGPCNAGFYCPLGATSGFPNCTKSYCSTGGPCTAGQECPKGTSTPSPCKGGSYCATSSGLVTGLCAAGYYCVQVPSEYYF